MARETELTIKCDRAGCSKAVGRSADHIELTLEHRIAQSDLPPGPTLAVERESFDFCSWEHALEFLREHAGETAAVRERLVSDAHEAARVDAQRKAEYARQAEDAAKEAKRVAQAASVGG